MFTPRGPGVDSEIAIIVDNVSIVNQPYFSPISVKNGIVANPPPTENRPTLKNSINN